MKSMVDVMFVLVLWYRVSGCDVLLNSVSCYLETVISEEPLIKCLIA
jgi:hypothetical protein